VLRSTGEIPAIADVLGDIMGLTKINYNACNFNDGLPVTVRFADKVGDVLSMGSARGAEKQPFKFYV
jgi:argonaute-like protein implicated in RNA metabolism and viral defense